MLNHQDEQALPKLELSLDPPEPRPFTMIDGRPLFLNVYGFTFEQPKKIFMPDIENIEHCLKWLRGYCQPIEKINKNQTSSKLKNAVERWVKIKDQGFWSISNGDFITAALFEGYKIKPVTHNNRRPSEPINAVFNIGLPSKKADKIAAGLVLY